MTRLLSRATSFLDNSSLSSSHGFLGVSIKVAITIMDYQHVFDDSRLGIMRATRGESSDANVSLRAMGRDINLRRKRTVFPEKEIRTTLELTTKVNEND